MSRAAVADCVERVEDPSADRGKQTKLNLTKNEPLFRAENSRKYNKAKLRENLNVNWETMTLTETLYYD